MKKTFLLLFILAYTTTSLAQEPVITVPRDGIAPEHSIGRVRPSEVVKGNCYHIRSLPICNHDVLQEDESYKNVLHVTANDKDIAFCRTLVTGQLVSHRELKWQIVSYLDGWYQKGQKNLERLIFSYTFFKPNQKMPAEHFSFRELGDNYTCSIPVVSEMEQPETDAPNKHFSVKAKGHKAKAHGLIWISEYTDLPEGMGLFLEYSLRFDADDFSKNNIEYNVKVLNIDKVKHLAQKGKKNYFYSTSPCNLLKILQ